MKIIANGEFISGHLVLIQYLCKFYWPNEKTILDYYVEKNNNPKNVVILLLREHYLHKFLLSLLSTKEDIINWLCPHTGIIEEVIRVQI